jgi:hypothetical protein
MYFVTAMSGIFQKYGVEMEVLPVNVPTTLQISNDCVQMSLLALKAILMKKDPQQTISPHYAKLYRIQILEKLLKDTDLGRAMIKLCGNDYIATLQAFEYRQQIRDKISSLFDKRNQVSSLRRKYDDLSIEEQSTSFGNKMWNEMIEKTSRIMFGVSEMERSVTQIDFICSSRVMKVKQINSLSSIFSFNKLGSVNNFRFISLLHRIRRPKNQLNGN